MSESAERARCLALVDAEITRLTGTLLAAHGLMAKLGFPDPKASRAPASFDRQMATLKRIRAGIEAGQ